MDILLYIVGGTFLIPAGISVVIYWQCKDLGYLLIAMTLLVAVVVSLYTCFWWPLMVGGALTCIFFLMGSVGRRGGSS